MKSSSKAKSVNSNSGKSSSHVKAEDSQSHSHQSSKVKIKAESKDNDAVEKDMVETKVEFKLGQKYPTPAPGMLWSFPSLHPDVLLGNGDRVFYQTLLEQNPSSEMAQEWCLYYGVVHDEVHAEKLYKLVSKRKGKDLSSPGKKSSGSSKSTSRVKKESSPPPRKRSRKVVESDDEDVGFEPASAWEQQGRVGV